MTAEAGAEGKVEKERPLSGASNQDLPELEDLKSACEKLPPLVVEAVNGSPVQSSLEPEAPFSAISAAAEVAEAEPEREEVTAAEFTVEESGELPVDPQGKEPDDDIIALESEALPAPRVPPRVPQMPPQVSPVSSQSPVLSRVEVQEVSARNSPVQVYEKQLLSKTHVVLLGDSTLDNERYLDVDAGGQPVGMQLSRRCSELDWELTMLATDGSTLDDVAIRQVPIIPDDATHLVLSASGNDLLRLLNEVASEEFSMSSLYSALTQGLQEVARKYRRILESMASTGCHIACCTVYRPNFKNTFLTGLSLCSLGLHNSRIRRIAEDLEMPVLDLATLCQDPEDFANPLELSTIGGRKVVYNVVQFVRDHPPSARPRPSQKDKATPWLLDVMGFNTECCISCGPRRNYAVTMTHEDLVQEIPVTVTNPSDFAQAQEQWRQS